MLQGSSSLISPSDADWLALAPDWLFLAHLTVGPPPPPAPAPRHLQYALNNRLQSFSFNLIIYLMLSIFTLPSIMLMHAWSLRHLIPPSTYSQLACC
ncbi:hypothetical protein BJX62DRAFT_196933 [Aspergillus germanicus]